MTDTTQEPGGIQIATIEHIASTRVWIESDLLGARHVVLQHEGCEPIDYASFGYDHRYTSNAGTWSAALQLARALGAAEPVEHRTRGLTESERDAAREFRDAVDSCVAAERAEIERLQAELKRANGNVEHCQQWYATRWETLKDWAHKLPEQQCLQFFDILANGSSPPDAPPTYSRQMALLTHERNRLRGEAEKLRAELERERAARQDAQRELEQARAERNAARLQGERDARRTLQHVVDQALTAEREACIDLVAFHGGPVDLEAAIRARGAAPAGATGGA